MLIQRKVLNDCVRHGLTAVDRVAMTSLRAALAANPIAMNAAAFRRTLRASAARRGYRLLRIDGRGVPESGAFRKRTEPEAARALPTWR